MAVRAVLMAMLIAGWLIGWSRPAAACSAGPLFEPRELTQLLVLGRVRSLEIGPRGATVFHQATITLDVLRVHRGSAGLSLTYVDMASVAIYAGVVSFGGGGACGTLDRDPVGQYVLIALAQGEDGRWYANRLFGAIYTDEPDHSAYRWLLQRHAVPVPFLVHGQVTEALLEPALTP